MVLRRLWSPSIGLLFAGCARLSIGAIDDGGTRDGDPIRDAAGNTADGSSPFDTGPDGTTARFDAGDGSRFDGRAHGDSDLDITYVTDAPDAGFLGPDGAIVCGHGDHLCSGVCVHDTSVASCAAACTPCSAPSNATATCNGFVCGFTCSAGFDAVGNACVPADRTRLIAPLSTSTVSSRRPSLHWSLRSGASGARVELCSDRACTSAIATIDATGTSATPASDLPTGVVFWRIHEGVGGAFSSETTATWQFTVPARSAPVDASWGTTLDVNGDGFADVVTNGGNPTLTTGRINVFMGRDSGLVPTAAFTIDDPFGPGAGFGAPMVSAGDVNGDGYADLVVGRSSYVSSPLYVFMGSSVGLTSLPTTVIASPDRLNSYFGRAIASAGDVNRDGYADFVIGGEISGGVRVYLFLGSSGGLSNVPASHVDSPSRGVTVASIAGVGDATGDGYPDLVIAADNEAYLYTGSPTGFGASPPVVLSPPGGIVETLGGPVQAGGDLNGDGYTDVLIEGMNSINVQATNVYFGGSTGIGTTPVMLPTRLPNAGLTAASGDVNGDGYGDIVTFESDPSAPSIDTYLGNATGIDATSQRFTVDSMTIPMAAITGAAPLGDVNGDGMADIALTTNATTFPTGGLVVLSGIPAAPLLRLLTVVSGSAPLGPCVATVLDLQTVLNGNGGAT